MPNLKAKISSYQNLELDLLLPTEKFLRFLLKLKLLPLVNLLLILLVAQLLLSFVILATLQLDVGVGTTLPLLLKARAKLTLLFRLLSIPILSVSDRNLPINIPKDLGTFVPGMPRFPITVLQAPICFAALLDPMARTLRKAHVVLQVLSV